MRFQVLDIVSVHERLERVVENAGLAERLGFLVEIVARAAVAACMIRSFGCQ